MPVPAAAPALDGATEARLPGAAAPFESPERVEARRAEQFGTIAVISIVLLIVGLLILGPFTRNGKAISTRFRHALMLFTSSD